VFRTHARLVYQRRLSQMLRLQPSCILQLLCHSRNRSHRNRPKPLESRQPKSLRASNGRWKRKWHNVTPLLWFTKFTSCTDFVYQFRTCFYSSDSTSRVSTFAKPFVHFLLYLFWIVAPRIQFLASIAFMVSTPSTMGACTITLWRCYIMPLFVHIFCLLCCGLLLRIKFLASIAFDWH